MKIVDFEKWLEDVCFAENPTVLDDDMPDFFDNWLGSLNGEDYIAYANEYASQDRQTSEEAIVGALEGMKETDSSLESSVTLNYTLDQAIAAIRAIYQGKETK